MAPTALGVFISGLLVDPDRAQLHRHHPPDAGARACTWFKLPLFVWAHYATSLIQVLGTPVIAITIVMLFVERVFGFGIFDPARGGDPVLFQHLFWFYSHPAVYIMILPALGVISELVSTFSRKRIFGYSFVAFSSLAIAVFGFIVWAHHMFVAGISIYAAMVFSFLSFSVAIPSAIKVFNWTATLHRGSLSFETPILYVYGFLGLFLIGGLTGLFLATLGVDVHLHDTYFVVAHFHYIMVGGAIIGYLGGLHFWWPKMFGRMYSDFWSRIAAILVFVGFNLTFFPQFILGYMGMPRRYHMYPDEFQVLNVLSSAGASILGVGYLLPAIYLLWSLKHGEVAGNNPVGRLGPRVAHAVAAADRELRGGADRYPRAVRVHGAGRPGGQACLTATATPTGPRPCTATAATPPTGTATPTTRRCSTTSTRWRSSGRRRRWACGCSCSPRCCSSAACSSPTPSTACGTTRRSPQASKSIAISWGLFNTAVLIGSSLTMALAVRSAQTSQRKATVNWLLATIVLGTVFLGVKVIEYADKFEHHHVPGPNFVWAAEHEAAPGGRTTRRRRRRRPVAATP